MSCSGCCTTGGGGIGALLKYSTRTPWNPRSSPTHLKHDFLWHYIPWHLLVESHMRSPRRRNTESSISSTKYSTSRTMSSRILSLKAKRNLSKTTTWYTLAFEAEWSTILMLYSRRRHTRSLGQCQESFGTCRSRVKQTGKGWCFKSRV
jgi:hypothetical protein